MPDASLALFYKVGPSPQTWWGMVRTSRDDGHTWSDAARLPDGILGPIKNKPVRLADGVILAPSSTESPTSEPLARPLRAQRRRRPTWTTSSAGGLADGHDIDAIQPSILIHPGGQAAGGRPHALGTCVRDLVGRRRKTWTPMTLTALPNPNSGIDAVTLRDGRHLIVYNHTDRGRSPLNVAVSLDGKTWQAALVLENEPGEYSYPAVIQTLGRARTHHLHLEAAAHQARRHRSGGVETRSDAGRKVAGNRNHHAQDASKMSPVRFTVSFSDRGPERRSLVSALSSQATTDPARIRPDRDCRRAPHRRHGGRLLAIRSSWSTAIGFVARAPCARCGSERRHSVDAAAKFSCRDWSMCIAISTSRRRT